jgi:hypothetical protein
MELVLATGHGSNPTSHVSSMVVNRVGPRIVHGCRLCWSSRQPQSSPCRHWVAAPLAAIASG